MPNRPANDTDETAKRLAVHEAVCAERYQAILRRVGRLETIVIASSGTLIVGMAGLIIKLAGH